MIWLLFLITYSHRFDSQNLNTWCWIRFRFLLFDFLSHLVEWGKKCSVKAEKTWSDMQRERNWFFLTSMCLHQLYHCAITKFSAFDEIHKISCRMGVYAFRSNLAVPDVVDDIETSHFLVSYFLLILSLPSPACLLPNTRKFQEICEIFCQLRFNSFSLHSSRRQMLEMHANCGTPIQG